MPEGEVACRGSNCSGRTVRSGNCSPGRKSTTLAVVIGMTGSRITGVATETYLCPGLHSC